MAAVLDFGDLPYEFEWDSRNKAKSAAKHGKILAAMKRYKDSKKKPTSVALDQTTIKELKEVAEKQGLPYQVLIRVFILNGLERLKKSELIDFRIR